MDGPFRHAASWGGRGRGAHHARSSPCLPQSPRATDPAVSTLAEIEKAIETLPAPQVVELAGWLERLRQRRTTTPAGGHRDLDALVGSWREDAAFDAAIRAFGQVDEAMWK